jgi:hypothetical protein
VAQNNFLSSTVKIHIIKSHSLENTSFTASKIFFPDSNNHFIQFVKSVNHPLIQSKKLITGLKIKSKPQLIPLLIEQTQSHCPHFPDPGKLSGSDETHFLSS